MNDVTDLVIPPIQDEYRFQDLCVDLWKRRYPNAQVKPYGRRGQAQDGIDVSVIDHTSGLVIGVQCKATGDPDASVSQKDLEDWAEKAKAFTPKLKHLVIATTRKTDKVTQDIVNTVSAASVKDGGFTIEVLSWEEILSDLKFHRDLVELYLPQYDWTGVAKEQTAQLDRVAKLLKRFRLKDAEEIMKEITSREWALAEPKIKARLITLQAHVKLIQNEIVEGARLLHEAYELDKHNEDRLCNYAHACAIEGRTGEALAVIDRVLDSNPNSAHAYSVAIGIWGEGETFESLIKRVPEAVQSSYRVASALGGVAAQAGDRELAIQWYERAIEDQEALDIADVLAKLAELHLSGVLTNTHFGPNERPDSSHKEKLERARKLYSDAVELIEDDSGIGTRHCWFFNSSVVNAILGNVDVAKSLMERALACDPNNPNYLGHRAKLDLMESGESAKTFLEQVSEDERSSGDWALVYSETLRKDKRFKEAEDVLRQFIQNCDHELLQREGVRLLFSLLLDQRKLSDAEALLDSSEAECLDSTQKEVYPARLLVSQGKAAEGRKVALEVFSSLSDSIDVLTWRELGKLLRDVGEFKAAADCFKGLESKSNDPAICKMVLENLFNAKEYLEALKLAKVQIEEEGPSRFVSEMAVSLCEVSGQLEEALRYCDEYLAVEPDDEYMKIHRLTILFRLNRREEVNEGLAEEFNLQELPVIAWLNLIRLNGELGNARRAIDLAYEAKRIHYTNSEVHNTLIAGYFVLCSQGDVLDVPQVVERDVAVELLGPSDSRKWILVEDRENLKPELYEYSVDHPTVKMLWGRGIGDEVQINLGTLEPESYKIVSLASKYAFAAYDSMEKFADLFPNDQGPLKVKVPRSKPGVDAVQLDPIVKIVSQQREHAEECLKLYKAGLLTVGAFAEMLGRHFSDVLWSLLRGSETPFRVSSGNAEEIKANLDRLGDESLRLVFDVTTVASLVHLGVGDVVGDLLKDRVLVLQSTLDLIRREKSHQNIHGEGYQVLTVEGGLPNLRDVSSEEIEAVKTFLNDIEEWINKYAIVQSTEASLSIDWDRKRQLDELLGASFVDTMLLASTSDYILVSDDYQLRILAKNEYGVDGSWSGELVNYLSRHGKLESNVQVKFAVDAVCSGYQHVPVNKNVMLFALKSDGWNLGDCSSAVFASLSDPTWSLQSLIGMLCDFSVSLWMEVVSKSQRDNILLAVLETTSKGRDPVVMASLIKRGIPHFCRLLPFYEAQIVSVIDHWLAMKVGQ